MTDIEKLCGRCGKSKSIVEFYRHSRMPDGLQDRCKTCSKESSTTWQNRNPQKTREDNREWVRKNQDKVKAIRHRRRAKKYGLTSEALLACEAAANGICQICLKEAKKMCVDHCHESGSIRGLICNNCNQALGLFRDDADALRRAADYIEAAIFKSLVGTL